MGKAARATCILTPFLLTLTSLILLSLIEFAGWHPTTLPSYPFFRANFTALSIPNADTTLGASLQAAHQTVNLGDIYHINLWNYCSANKTSSSSSSSSSPSAKLDYCSPRTSEFYFDPITVWGLNSTSSSASAAAAAAAAAGNNNNNNHNAAIQNAVNHLKANSQDELEDQLLGESGRKALEAYRTASKWMFIAYQVSFWTTVATLVVSILALFSRWGSLLTWVLSVVSTVFTFGAVLTSTVLFSVLVGALKGLLDRYNVGVEVGTQAMVVGWVAVVCSLGATFFWLFSICCCSGKSNPHHKSNKGGLWNAEPKGMGYERGARAEKVGSYERVETGQVGQDDNVPLYPYPQQTARHNENDTPYGLDAGRGAGYEPYRHNY